MITADGVSNLFTQDDKQQVFNNSFSNYKVKKKSKSNEDKDESPVKFLGVGAAIGIAQGLYKNRDTIKGVAQGIKNRDEYGGGIKGAVKGIAGQFTGQTEKQRFENINEKLDSISEAVGVAQEQTEPMDNTTETSQDQVEAQSPMMMKSIKKKVLAKTGTGRAHNMSAAQYKQEGLMTKLSGNDSRMSTEGINSIENLDFINDMSPMNKYNCKK